MLKMWLSAEKGTRHTVPMSAVLSMEIRALMSGRKDFGANAAGVNVMKRDCISKLFELVYFRVVKFVGFVDEFRYSECDLGKSLNF